MPTTRYKAGCYRPCYSKTLCSTHSECVKPLKVRSPVRTIGTHSARAQRAMGSPPIVAPPTTRKEQEQLPLAANTLPAS